jgi:hypothetical protein
MVEELKVYLGEAAANFTEAQLGLAMKLALAEVQGYCNRELDYELEVVALQIAKIKLNRLNTEGLLSQGLSGISESYIDGYPAEIQAVLDRKRKLRVI